LHLPDLLDLARLLGLDRLAGLVNLVGRWACSTLWTLRASRAAEELLMSTVPK
jgi:hypothetical protein